MTTRQEAQLEQELRDALGLSTEIKWEEMIRIVQRMKQAYEDAFGLHFTSAPIEAPKV